MLNEREPYSKRSKLPLLAALFCGLWAFVIYLPTLGYGFLSWDDPLYIVNNLNIRELDLDTIKWSFTGSVLGNRHPVTMLSHALDIALFGMKPGLHHLTSNILHAINTILLFFLSFRLIIIAETAKTRENGNRAAIYGAATCALIFALHPLRVESVVWLSERKDLLSALFYLATILSYLKYRRVTGGRAGWYMLSLSLLALSLLSKPMAVSLPVVLIILDLYPLGRKAELRSVIIEKLPFFALALFAAWVAYDTQAAYHALDMVGPVSLSTRVAVVFKGFIFYLYKTIVPFGLSPIYPYPKVASLLSPVHGLSFLIFIAISAYALYSAKKRPWLLALWGYYVVTLLPVIGIVQVGVQEAADRYSYLPLIAVAIGAGLLIYKISSSRPPIRPSSSRLIAFFLIVLFLFLSTLTIKQSGFWADTLSLWTRQISLYPNRIALPYNNRGSERLRLGMIEGALDDFNRAIETEPEKVSAYNNRGLLFMELGRGSESLADFTRAVTLAPSSPDAYNNRGLLFQKSGDMDSSLRDLTRSIELDPKRSVPYLNRGITLMRIGKMELAEKDFDRALQIDPNNASALNNRAILFENTGRRALAIKDLTAAIEIDQKSADQYNNRGGVLLNAGRYDEAIKDLTRALELDPSIPDPYINLEVAYRLSGDLEKAKYYAEIIKQISDGKRR